MKQTVAKHRERFSLEEDKHAMLRAQIGADIEELNDRVNALENVPDKWPVAMDDALMEIEERVAHLEQRVSSVQKYVNDCLDALECQDCEKGTYSQLYIKDEIAKIKAHCEQCYLESQGEGP